MVERFSIEKGAFDTAGTASSKIKAMLKKLGIPPNIVRDVAISAYEAELNLVIHSDGGELILEIAPDILTLTSADTGPGIADIELAMKEGYSTAPESVRSLGFGAGMGLPNVERHCHEFSITSELGEGTIIRAIYYLHNTKDTQATPGD